MSKKSIYEMDEEYRLGRTISKIAKERKHCFRHIRKLFIFLSTLKDWENQGKIDKEQCEKAY